MSGVGRGRVAIWKFYRILQHIQYNHLATWTNTLENIIFDGFLKLKQSFMSKPPGVALLLLVLQLVIFLLAINLTISFTSNQIFSSTQHNVFV